MDTIFTAEFSALVTVERVLNILRYINKMCWTRWQRWSTKAGGLAVFCFYFLYPLPWGGTILLAICDAGTISMVISVRRPHFIDYLREEAPFYWVNLGRGWWMCFYLSPKLCWRLAGISYYSPCSTADTNSQVCCWFVKWVRYSGLIRRIQSVLELAQCEKAAIHAAPAIQNTCICT